jgi:glycosyltransferase involved in cell wall biosynthesis
MPRVTVVILTCNRAQMFGRALDSALAQTERDIEVVVIDDGSPDDAAERVVRDRGDARIRYIKFPTHRGVSAARNAGVLAATSQYIAFLDDDDEWLPQKLERQLETIENSDDAVGAVYTARFTIEEATGRTTTTRIARRFRPGDGNTMTTSSILLKRECLTYAGAFDEEFEAGEDYDMWIRVARRYQFTYIDVPLVKYYVHAGNVSKHYAKKIRAIHTMLEKHGSLFAQNRHDLSRQFTQLGVFYYHYGDLRQAVRAFRRAVRACPHDIHIYSAAVRTFLRPHTLRLATRKHVPGVP